MFLKQGTTHIGIETEGEVLIDIVDTFLKVI